MDRPDRRQTAAPPGTTRPVEARRLSTGGPSKMEALAEAVAVESPLTIDIADVGAYTIMCTPTETRALAIGFVLAEGIISGLDDVVLLQDCPDDPNVIRMAVVGKEATEGPSRNLAVLSSCGLCGSQSLDELVSGLPSVGDSLRLSARLLRRVSEEMQGRQIVFTETGGSHAAAIYNAGGEVLAMAEDIGRHNALDKAIGKCLLAGTPIAGLAAALSGRVSLEIVVKAARAGLELISAVSAPTSLAIEAASACGVTLCGFVRSRRATVYTHPRRVAPL